MAAEIDPDLALELAKATADTYSRAVEELLKIVARQVRAGTYDPGNWSAQKLAETRRLQTQAQAIVDRLAAGTPEMIGSAVTAGYEAGMPSGMIATHTRAVDRLIAEAVTRIESTYGQILRSTIDGYRDVILQATTLMDTGVLSLDQAIGKALQGFADRGITGFVDAAGRAWRLDRYAEMATRTAVGRSMVAGTLDRLVADGRDLVIVSDHQGACPVCAPWEGKVLSISGATTGRVADGDGRRPTIAGTVAEAQAAGLQHPNCRHSLGAFVPGLTTRPEPRTPPTDGQERRRRENAAAEARRQAARRRAVETRSVSREEIRSGQMDESRMGPAELEWRRRRAAEDAARRAGRRR